MSCVTVTIGRVLQVSPWSELERVGQIPHCIVEITLVLEGTNNGKSVALVARAIVQPHQAQHPLCIINMRDEAVTIPKGITSAILLLYQHYKKLLEC